MFPHSNKQKQKSSKKGKPQEKLVESVRFPISAETGKINGVEFIFCSSELNEPGDHQSINSNGASTTTPASRVFVLQPPHEYIVCVRYNELAGELTGVQVQTNLGRRSRFYYGLSSSEEKQHAQRLGTRIELYAPRGEAIIGFSSNTNHNLNTAGGEFKQEGEDKVIIKQQNDAKSRFQIETGPIPHVKRKKLRRLLLMPSVRGLLLKSNEVTGKSAASQMLRGGRKAVAMHAVRHGLAGKMLAAGEDGDALIRLILDGEQHNGARGMKKRDSLHSVSAASTVSAIRSTTRRINTLFTASSRKPDSDDEEEADDDDFDDQAIDEMFGEESISFPPSILRALCEAGPNLGVSLLDLLSAGRERDGRPPLMRILFESGVAKIIFRRKRGSNECCLAELMMTPDRVRGLRSLMQLMTDDEALDDPNRPSLLRSLLIGEERGDRPSVLRLMFLKTPGRAVTSLMDELLKGEDEFDSCARRLLIETEERPISLSRLFFSDTPGGKPALAKYVFGGESEAEPRRPSLMRLMVQGEAREQNSLLRLLVGFRGSTNKSLLDLLTCGQPSLMDLLLKGEETAQETSLGRLMLGTTFTIQNGRLVMGSALGSSSSNAPPPAALVSRLTMPDDDENKSSETDHLRKRLERGLTMSKAFMLGEEDGGPGISFMRVLLMGEEQGLSVLRLLLTGEESNEVSPLRIIFTGLHTVFVVAQVAADSSKQMQTESLLDIATQPKKWGDALQMITRAVVDSVNESHQVGGSWRDSFDKLIELGRTRLRSRDAWQQNIAFLYTAFARVRSMGPEFAKTWKKQWTIVSKEIRLTGQRVRPESAWKQLAPVIAVLTESIAEQHWQKVFVDVAHIIQAVEVAAGRQTDKNFAKVVSVIDEIFNWAPRWF